MSWSTSPVARAPKQTSRFAFLPLARQRRLAYFTLMQIATFNLARELGSLLLARSWQVTCGESCTGGGIASAITAVPGCSSWFGAGFVTYSNQHKTRMLGVKEATLLRVGAVSREVVEEMAAGALVAVGADIAVAVSGIAGPEGGSDAKPVGTVWLAWATRDNVDTVCRHLAGDRESIRSQAVDIALQGLIERIKSTV